VNIYLSAEQHYKANVESNTSKVNLLKLVTLVGLAFVGQPVFDCLNQHVLDGDPLQNHVCLLIKCIAAMYLECRLAHAAKMTAADMNYSKRTCSRQMSNKLILFNGL
jgi:hypothetical protein